MYFYFSILLFVLIPLSIFGWLYFRMASQVRNKAMQRIRDLESRYNEFLRKRLTLAFIQEKDWQEQREAIMQEAQEVVKPDLDALAALIASTSYPINTGEPPSSTFRNLMATAQELLAKAGNPQVQPVRRRLYEDFMDAMRADLATRWLDFQVGEHLAPR